MLHFSDVVPFLAYCMQGNGQLIVQFGSSIPCYTRLCNPGALATDVFNLAFVFPNCSPKVHVSLWAVCYRKFVSRVAVWMAFKLVEGIATWSTPSSSTSFALDRSSHIQSYTMYQTYSCMCVCVWGGGGGGRTQTKHTQIKKGLPPTTTNKKQTQDSLHLLCAG